MKTKEQYQAEQRFNHAAKTRGIDLGLAVLSAIRQPGERYSRYVIAAACDCCPQLISEIERQALKKLANRLRFQKDAVLQELCESVIGRAL